MAITALLLALKTALVDVKAVVEHVVVVVHKAVILPAVAVAAVPGVTAALLDALLVVVHYV